LESPLTYVLQEPKNIQENKVYPAIFLMHGMGSNEYDLIPLVHPFKDDVYVFSLRGPLELGYGGYAFFTFEHLGKPHRHVFDDTIQKIMSFITYAKENYPIDSNQLFLMGFSQGAILSMTTSLLLGDKIKGVVALSGYVPAFVKNEYVKQSVNHLNIFISHGEHDQVLPFEWGLDSYEMFKELGANVTFKAYNSAHTVSQENYEDLTSWLEEHLNQNN